LTWHSNQLESWTLAFTLGDSAKVQGSCAKLLATSRMSNMACISLEAESNAMAEAEAEAIKPEMAT
jgi:hypothetical protein